MPRLYTSLRNHGILLLEQCIEFQHGDLLLQLMRYLWNYHDGSLFQPHTNWTEEESMLFSVAVNLLLFTSMFTDYSVNEASPFRSLLTPAFHSQLMEMTITQCIQLKRQQFCENRNSLFYTSCIRSLFLLPSVYADLHLSLVDEAGDNLWPTLPSFDRVELMRAMAWVPHLFSFQTRVHLFRDSLPLLQNASSVEIKVRRNALVDDAQAVFTSMLSTKRQFVQRFFVGTCVSGHS